MGGQGRLSGQRAQAACTACPCAAQPPSTHQPVVGPHFVPPSPRPIAGPAASSQCGRAADPGAGHGAASRAAAGHLRGLVTRSGAPPARRKHPAAQRSAGVRSTVPPCALRVLSAPPVSLCEFREFHDICIMRARSYGPVTVAHFTSSRQGQSRAGRSAGRGRTPLPVLSSRALAPSLSPPPRRPLGQRCSLVPSIICGSCRIAHGNSPWAAGC